MATGVPRLDGLSCAPYFEGQGMTSDARHKLLELLAKYAYDYKPGAYKLASGIVSDEYLDCKEALSQPAAQEAVGDLFLMNLDTRAVAVGGLTMGADPIAINTARSGSSNGRPLRWFCVRKVAKEHGRKKIIEGAVQPGESVVVVDDVVTKGGSTVEAIQKCRAHGLKVIQVLVLVDREQGGLQAIKEEAGEGVEVRAIFTKAEVSREWEARRQTLRATA